MIVCDIYKAMIVSDEVNRAKVCNIGRAFYGLKVSPWRWNGFSSKQREESVYEIKPGLFTSRGGDEF